MPLTDRLASWMNLAVLGRPLWEWTAALAVALLVFAVLLLFRGWLRSRLKRRAVANGTGLSEVLVGTLKRTNVLFLLAMGALAGSLVVDFGEQAVVLRRVLVTVALLQAGLWSVALLTGLLARWREARTQDASAATIGAAAAFLGKLAIWTVVALLVLDNLGVKVTTLVAGLGIGGVAIALAVQNILGDLLASVSIVLDKPFEVGDFIIVGELMGTVENVGLKTTRVRSLSGEQLIFANHDLLGSRIRNFKRMNERRAVFSIGVTYETPHAKLAAIPAMLRAVVESQPEVRFDRAHFARYGDFALIFEVVYNVLKPDMHVYMDTQQAINLEIFRRFEAEGIAFAYPTQTLYVNPLPTGPAAAARP